MELDYMNYPKFTTEMKKTHKILIPNMAPVQFRILAAAMEQAGYQCELLENCGSEVSELGLKYVHNDTCYPALLVIGQFLDALNSGKYDRGIVVAETFDYEIIDKAYAPYGNLSLLVSLQSTGSIEKKVIGSVVESLKADYQFEGDWARLVDIFRKPSLHKVMEAPIPPEKRFSARMSDTAGTEILTEHQGLLLGTSNPNHKAATALINDGRLAGFISRLRTQVDYIVLDTPPMLAAADAEAIALFADTALDVSSDISGLNTLLAQEGLTGDGFKTK